MIEISFPQPNSDTTERAAPNLPQRSSLILAGAALAFLIAVMVSARAAGLGDDLAQELAAANELFTAKKFPEAQKAYERVLQRAPKNAEANHRLGLFASSRGDWENALKLQEAAVTAEPGNPKYQHEWGEANATAARNANVFTKISYARKCLAGFLRAVELEPANVRYRRSLFDYYFEAPGIAGGDIDKAKQEAEEVGKLDAEVGRQCLVKILVSKRQYDEAFRLYDEARKKTPDDYRVLYSFGRLTLESGQRFEDGLVALRRCLELQRPPGAPSPAEVHWCAGAIHEKLKHLDAAREEYRAALKIQPKYGVAKEALRKLEAASR